MLIERYKDSDLRGLVWSIINLTQANQLFVHSNLLEINHFSQDNGKKLIRTRFVPEILVVCVLNALVPNSSILLIGGHGGAKTSLAKLLGRMFTGKKLSEIEEAILRGHPQLTEEKILATLNLAKLMQGEEDVIWRKFVTEFWKIIDEVNRMSPYAQNILLSLLAERRVKFYDRSEEVKKFCLYATMNPPDEGTFELPLPFLDRFGISLPFSMPTTHDMSLILKARDEKLFGYDEAIQVPEVLKIEDLVHIWSLVDNQPVDEEAEEFIHAIVREFSICDRINKGVSNEKEIGPDLCEGCHFNTTKSVCNKVKTILSVRAAKDLLRYSKALGWLMGVPVDIHLVLTIAPYVIQHRVEYVSSEANLSPHFGNKMSFTKTLLDMVKVQFARRQEPRDAMKRIKKGESDATHLKMLEGYAKNDIVVKHDFLPMARIFLDDRYTMYLNKIEEAYTKRDVDGLLALKNELLNDADMLNKGEILTKIGVYLNTISLCTYDFTFDKWRDQVWAGLATEFRFLDEKLRMTLVEPFTGQLRTSDSIISINITGNEDDSYVFLTISGGNDALKVRDILNEAGVFNADDLKS